MPRIFKFKDIGASWHSEFNESAWRGFMGNWYGGVHDPNTYQVMQGLRTWRWRDSSRRILDQINVYGTNRPGTVKRERDGLGQMTLQYTGKMVEPEFREEPVSLERASVVALSPAVLAWLSRFWLPPVAVAGPPPRGVLAAAQAAADDEGKVVAAIRSDSWGMEIFLRDGDCRWSFPLVYDAATGALTRTALIQEHYTGVDPSTPHVLTAERHVVPRPQLPDDPASWVTHGPHGPAEGPPEEDTFLRIRLPDAMYMKVPKSIAVAAEAAVKAETTEAAAAEAPKVSPAAPEQLRSNGVCGDTLRFEFGDGYIPLQKHQ
ncbi:hypothetical protein VOLCADRAFT_96508 [Volvox carteri f. nagariensis]|uniref:Uncharacterized protein n=1 Tax=Volvox carteri f. nagariensis TaxID=3068 RepID=D8UAA7_VOLCA|nr:uncharacterized protein VOLCADRAFT_96508 [Volvox carteri f. nagariensis]EFJ43233.1 hypothetical protein VOLCADRAFT_96508 [Volvox carteri f. nagariensis]|eukprot:XP_002955593.1 hypothetical protein VOLCADRAFT_96508 [Volvox carteri f. nagariensis]